MDIWLYSVHVYILHTKIKIKLKAPHLECNVQNAWLSIGHMVYIYMVLLEQSNSSFSITTPLLIYQVGAQQLHLWELDNQRNDHLQSEPKQQCLRPCSASFCWTFWSNTRCSPQDEADPECRPAAELARTSQTQTPGTHNLQQSSLSHCTGHTACKRKKSIMQWSLTSRLVTVHSGGDPHTTHAGLTTATMTVLRMQKPIDFTWISTS